MPIKISLAQFESPILAIYPLPSSRLLLVTAKHEIYLYDSIDNTKERLLHLKIPEEATLYHAFDPVHYRFIFGTDQSDLLHLIDLERKKLIRRFELDRQFPTALAFDGNGAYIVCGTDQGRVLLWRSDSAALIARMHSFPDYSASAAIKPKHNFVSAIVFEENLVATTGYGGSIVITDYQSQTQAHRLNPGHVKNGALLFYKETLIVGNQSGTLLKLDRHTKYPAQRLATSLGPVAYLLKVGIDPYILAASRQRRIMLIDADEMKIISDRYIELDEDITSLSKDEADNLLIGTQDGRLYRVDLQPTQHLDSLIFYKNYAEAYHYVRQEPLLQKSGSFQKLESIFEKAMQSAASALEKGENEKAKTLLQPFESVKSKEINALSTAYAQMPRLKHFFQQQKLSPFYGLIEQYPLLRSTSLFAQVEKFWNAQFSQAQKFMFTGKVKEAKEELKLFLTVGAKMPFIQLLLQHVDVLKSCSKAIHEHDYQTLRQLNQRYPIIRKLPSYIQLIEEAGELAPAIIDALKAKEFEQAVLLLDGLADVVQYEEEYLRLKTFVSHAANLHHAIANSQWRSAYTLLSTHSGLLILPWAKELEDEWHQKLQRCETYAIHADVSAIQKELSTLINLPGRHGRVGDILRTAYQVQLRQLLGTDHSKFKAGIDHYCELFGMDTELRSLIKTAQAQGFTTPLDSVLFLAKNRDYWLGAVNALPAQIA